MAMLGIDALNCAIFGLLGQLITNVASFLYFSVWTYWISVGDVPKFHRMNIHLGLNIFALLFIIYSLLMSCHLSYVIHRDFDNMRAYFWTRLHLTILGAAFTVLTMAELFMYLEISHLSIPHLLQEILDTTPKQEQSSPLLFPPWVQNWQREKNCCGIVGYKDYINYGDRKSVSPDCCRWNRDVKDETGWNCATGVLRMTYPFIQEKIHTAGCGESMKRDPTILSLWGCVLTATTTLFTVIASINYLSFVREYSEEQHLRRMREYEEEEKEQLKQIAKKRHQSPRNSSKGTAHGHSTTSERESQSQQRRSRSNSRSRAKSNVSAFLHEEKAYLNHSTTDNLKMDWSSRTNFEEENSRQKSHDNKKLLVEKRRSSSVKSESSGGGSGRSRNNSQSRGSRSKNVSPGRSEQPEEDVERYNASAPDEFPAFNANSSLFMNLIDAASSRRTSKNTSTTSSAADFQEDVLVPRVLLKKTKQVNFDSDTNIQIAQEQNELKQVVSLEFEEEQSNCESPVENYSKTVEGDNCGESELDPGDVIVNTLSEQDFNNNNK